MDKVALFYIYPFIEILLFHKVWLKTYTPAGLKSECVFVCVCEGVGLLPAVCCISSGGYWRIPKEREKTGRVITSQKRRGSCE